MLFYYEVFRATVSKDTNRLRYCYLRLQLLLFHTKRSWTLSRQILTCFFKDFK